ncbi:hypothetical protein L195_g034794, partial [Trifolium pratense]
MATYNNGQFPANLPILDVERIMIIGASRLVLFNYQDVMDQVTNGVDPLTEGATENQRTQHKELKKKDFKTLFIIHQSVSPNIFEKKVKKVKLQTLRRQFAQLQMEDKETLQGSLEAHEQRMNQRYSNKSKGEIALQAQQGNKDKNGKGKWQDECRFKDESSDAEAKMARNDDDDDDDDDDD